MSPVAKPARESEWRKKVVSILNPANQPANILKPPPLKSSWQWLAEAQKLLAESDRRGSFDREAQEKFESIGVMNHISLGVKEFKAAQAKLEAYGWKASDREHSLMGKDGMHAHGKALLLRFSRPSARVKHVSA